MNRTYKLIKKASTEDLIAEMHRMREMRRTMGTKLGREECMLCMKEIASELRKRESAALKLAQAIRGALFAPVV